MIDTDIPRYFESALLSQLAYSATLPTFEERLSRDRFIEEISRSVENVPQFDADFAERIADKYEFIRGYDTGQGFQAILVQDISVGNGEYTLAIRGTEDGGDIQTDGQIVFTGFAEDQFDELAPPH